MSNYTLPLVSRLTSVISKMWLGSILGQLRKHCISWDLQFILRQRWMRSFCSFTGWDRLPPCPAGEGSPMLPSCTSGAGKIFRFLPGKMAPVCRQVITACFVKLERGVGMENFSFLFHLFITSHCSRELKTLIRVNLIGWGWIGNHSCIWGCSFSSVPSCITTTEHLSPGTLGSSSMNVPVDWWLFMSSRGISAMELSAGSQPSTQNRYSARWTLTG